MVHEVGGQLGGHHGVVLEQVRGRVGPPGVGHQHQVGLRRGRGAPRTPGGRLRVVDHGRGARLAHGRAGPPRGGRARVGAARLAASLGPLQHWGGRGREEPQRGGYASMLSAPPLCTAPTHPHTSTHRRAVPRHAPAAKLRSGTQGATRAPSLL